MCVAPFRLIVALGLLLVLQAIPLGLAQQEDCSPSKSGPEKEIQVEVRSSRLFVVPEERARRVEVDSAGRET